MAICVKCGKSFRIVESTKFCSPECKAAWAMPAKPAPKAWREVNGYVVSPNMVKAGLAAERTGYLNDYDRVEAIILAAHVVGEIRREARASAKAVEIIRDKLTEWAQPTVDYHKLMDDLD